MAAGHSFPDARPQAQGPEAPRPAGTLRCRPRLTSTANGGVEGPPPLGLLEDRLSARRPGRRPARGPPPPGDRLSVRKLARRPTGGPPRATALWNFMAQLFNLRAALWKKCSVRFRPENLTNSTVEEMLARGNEHRQLWKK